MQNGLNNKFICAKAVASLS